VVDDPKAIAPYQQIGIADDPITIFDKGVECEDAERSGAPVAKEAIFVRPRAPASTGCYRTECNRAASPE